MVSIQESLAVDFAQNWSFLRPLDYPGKRTFRSEVRTKGNLSTAFTPLPMTCRPYWIDLESRLQQLTAFATESPARNESNK
jgi:hypothetical protein